MNMPDYSLALHMFAAAGLLAVLIAVVGWLVTEYYSNRDMQKWRDEHLK